jgi:preprotein translocase subunit SecG
MKLNGWQRLWVVISLLWVASVLTYTITNKQSESEIHHNWANDLIGYLISQVSDLKDYSVTSLRSKYSDLSDKELVEALHKKYIEKHPAYRFGFSEIDAKYEGKVSGKKGNLFTYILVALFFPISIYLLGWAFAWVRSGFKKDNKSLKSTT